MLNEASLKKKVLWANNDNLVLIFKMYNLKKYFIIFRERGKEGEREGKKHHDSLEAMKMLRILN